MALSLEDIIAGQKRYAEGQKQQNSTERMSMEEFKKMTGAVSVSADAVQEKSAKVIEEQSKNIEEVSQSVSDDGKDGLYKESTKQTEILEEISESQKKQLASLVEMGKNFDVHKTAGEKIKDKFAKFSPSNIRETMLNKMNIKLPGVGGIFDKAIKKERFVKEQRMFGSTKTRSELNEDFEGANKASKEIQSVTAKMEGMRAAAPGMSDEQLESVPEFARLKKQREGASKQYSKFDVKSNYVAPEPSQTRKGPEAAAVAEKEEESSKLVEDQTELLKKVEENTRPEGVEGRHVAPEKKSGFMGNLQGLGRTLGDSAKGLVALGAALWVISKAFGNFAELDWEGMTKGLIGMGALVVAAKVLDKSTGSLLKGALGVAALGGAMWVASKGFSSFAEIDWETLGKAGLAITGLAVAAAGIGTFAAPIAMGALVLAGLGAAVWVVGEAISNVSEGMDDMISSIERLGDIDGNNLLSVGAGLVAIAGGIVAFGAANAVAGVENLVGGFLGAITPGKTPVEQLLEISNAGPNIQSAGTGIQAFAEGLAKFSAVDKSKLEVIATLPNDKIIALGEAIGKATPQPRGTANMIYGASAENAGTAATGGGNVNTNVVAPTVNNTRNETITYRSDVRNQDSSFKRMLDNRQVAV